MAHDVLSLLSATNVTLGEAVGRGEALPIGATTTTRDGLPSNSIDQNRTDSQLRRDFRVIKLHSGVEDEPMRCEIEVASLDDDVSFEALSYVWGDLTDAQCLEMAGQKMLVTKSLFAALRRLRYPQTPRMLWIDQLCIQQWDSTDKARQVALMRDIYRKCSQCLIWLGEIPRGENGEILEARNIQAVFDFIGAVADVESNPITVLPILLQDTPDGTAAREAFAAFAMYGNAWWSRIWTVQEAIIPPHATIVWGEHRITRSAVFRASLNLRGNPYVCEFSLEFKQQRAKCAALLRRMLYPVHGFLHSQAGERPLNLLMRWRHRDSTDARDKIYGLLGLLPRDVLPSAQACRYDIPPEVLFARVTLDLIRDEGGLRSFIGASDCRLATEGLPSWAIDFACTNRLGRYQLKWWNRSHRYQVFDADAGRRLQITPEDNEKAISLVGTRFGEVKSVCMGCEEGEITDTVLHDTFMRFVFAVKEHTDRSSKQTDNTRLRIEPGDFEYALHDVSEDLSQWRTLLGDVESEENLWRTTVGNLLMAERPVRRTCTADGMVFDRLIQRLQEASSEPRGPLYESFVGMLTGYAFFITESGCFGMGPQGTKAGDHVWAIHGGKVPFVLRKGSKEGRFKLVGDAYVDGIMDGEAVRSGEEQTVWVE